MNAAIAEMAVHTRFVAVQFHQRREFAQVGAEMARLHGGIFPADDRIGLRHVVADGGSRRGGFAG